ncbi:MAG: hypothetical protein M3127_03300 [Actinomycetota bacterium]|nr:hypothetical protein [Actinomycetota bacterium]
MPICINLLAEAKATEELRRKDPVKRGIFIAGFLVFLVFLWSSTLQFKIIAAKSDLGRLEARWKEIEKNYQTAIDTRKKSSEVEHKLVALQNLTTNRFLWGTALNAVQQTLNGIEDVHVTRVKSEQAYQQNEEIKPRRDAGRLTPGRPASAVERISITLDAVDRGGQPGGSVSRFKEMIASVPYFEKNLTKTNGVLLTSLSAPQNGPTGQPQVLFTVQCFFPEKVRQ